MVRQLTKRPSHMERVRPQNKSPLRVRKGLLSQGKAPLPTTA